MGAAVSSLWRHAWAEQPPEKLKEIRTIGPAALGALAVEGVPVDQATVLAALRDRLDGAFPANGAVESQRDALRVAASFVDAKLLDRRSLSDLNIACCTATFLAALPAETPGEWEQVPAEAYDRVLVAAVTAGAEALNALRNALPEPSWLAEDRRANLTLAVAAAQHGLDQTTPSPYTPEEVAGMLVQHGAGFHEGATIWLGTFAATPGEAWVAFADTATVELPDALSGTLRTFSQRLDAKDKLELVTPALKNALSAPPSASFLRAVRFTEADQREAAALIIDLAKQASEERVQIGSVPGAVTPRTLWNDGRAARKRPRPRHQEGKSRCKLISTHRSASPCRRHTRASRDRPPFGSCAIAFRRARTPRRCSVSRGRRRGVLRMGT